MHDEKPTMPLADDHYPHGVKLVLLAGASIVAVFLIALDQTIVGTAIPKITDEFHSLGDVSWYAAAYFMTFGATQTSAGKIYKYYNLKWSFLASMVIFEVGSLICGVAPNSKALIIGRAIAGLGGAGLSVGGTSIVSFTVPPKNRPMMMGIIGMVYCIAAVIGPILGGVFTEKATWRWCFYINLPIGGIAAVVLLFYFHLPAAGAPPKLAWWKKLLHIDPFGIALAMSCITCLILALQYGGNTHPWNSSVVIGLLIGFGLLVISLIVWENWLGEYAMMLPRLYRQRSLTASAAFQFFFMGSYIVLLYYLPIYFQSILGASPLRSGVDNLPLVVAAAIFALAGGAVVMKTGRAQQVMFSGSMLSTIAIGLIYTFDIGTPTATWVGYQFFLGATMAFAIMHGLIVAQANVGPEDLAAVTANLMFFQTIGGAFSTAIGQSVFINRLLATLHHTAPSVGGQLVLATGASQLQSVFSPDVLHGVQTAYMVGLKAAFAVAVSFCGTAFLCSLAVPMQKLPSHAPGENGIAMG
ncbi:MFS general substrate transporter [Myriangium duriaei CBS 260.36]|uniref:MFS general substrate transporter n=1 Tax=Myriangium duriaei CBS 260.36 TaxID=1168546 RepID=A0A9P4IX37_9PEZI|nr:MFS general substrate transporter [Myriangium duriaei CBS 260.36]